MSKEIRQAFEATLLRRLQTLAAELPGARAFRNQIQFREGRGVHAALHFEHLAKVGGSHPGQCGGGIVHEFCRAHPPPYKSNLLNPDYTMMFNSLPDPDRRFADEAGGVVRVWNMDRHDAICNRLIDKIRAHHLSRLPHYLTALPSWSKTC